MPKRIQPRTHTNHHKCKATDSHGWDTDLCRERIAMRERGRLSSCGHWKCDTVEIVAPAEALGRRREMAVRPPITALSTGPGQKASRVHASSLVQGSHGLAFPIRDTVLGLASSDALGAVCPRPGGQSKSPASFSSDWFGPSWEAGLSSTARGSNPKASEAAVRFA